MCLELKAPDAHSIAGNYLNSCSRSELFKSVTDTAWLWWATSIHRHWGSWHEWLGHNAIWLLGCLPSLQHIAGGVLQAA